MVAVSRSECNAQEQPGRADELTEAIRRAHDAMVACQAELLRLVAEYDAARYHEADGAHSMGEWLVWMLGVSGATGRDWARAARRLATLPAVAEAFADGDLSYDQTRVLTRFVTSHDDAEWADEGPRHSVDELTRIARKARPVTADQAQDAHERRFLRHNWDHEAGLLRGSFALAADDGETLVKSLERDIDRQLEECRYTEDAQRIPYQARLADALVDLAGRAIAADPDPDRATVLVQVPADSLTGGSDEGGWIEGGPALSAETARRLACDCRYQTVTFDEFGIAIGLGRTRRSVPPHLARAIRLRDHTCRWPGCDRTRRLRIHHVTFWANGGRTDSDNLAATCPAHHRLVHEGRYQITGNANAALTYRRPDGTRIGTTRPPPT